MTFKPKCDDFVIAAIETLRRRPDNINPPDAWSGVLLQRLYKVASPVYSATEVVGAVQRLLKKQVLLAVSEGAVGVGPREVEKLFAGTVALLEDNSVFWRFKGDHVMLPGRHSEEEWQSGPAIPLPKLFLKRDKISSRLLESITKNGKLGPGKKQKPSHRKTKAELIIESMRQS